MQRTQASPYIIDVVGKALDVLEAMQDSDEITLQEICRRTGLPKSSAFRVLTTLEERGYVERGTADRGYCLTMKLVEISHRLLGRNPLRTMARPHMLRVAELTGETVNLGVLLGGDIVYVEIIDSERPFRVTETPGSRSPVYASALGKAIAAHLPESELQRLIELQSFQRLTPRTIGSREHFREELARVSRMGYAVDDEEGEEGVRCVAAPIVARGNYPLAAMSISAPAIRLPLTAVEERAAIIRSACLAVSAHLSYRA